MNIVWTGPGGKILTDFFSKKLGWYPGTSIPNHGMVKLCVRGEYRGNYRANTKSDVAIILNISLKKNQNFYFILDAGKIFANF